MFKYYVNKCIERDMKLLKNKNSIKFWDLNRKKQKDYGQKVSLHVRAQTSLFSQQELSLLYEISDDAFKNVRQYVYLDIYSKWK